MESAGLDFSLLGVKLIEVEAEGQEAQVVDQSLADLLRAGSVCAEGLQRLEEGADQQLERVLRVRHFLRKFSLNQSSM